MKYDMHNPCSSSTNIIRFIKEQSNLTLYFENDVLARAEGDAIQKSIEAVQAGQNIVPTTETKPK